MSACRKTVGTINIYQKSNWNHDRSPQIVFFYYVIHTYSQEDKTGCLVIDEFKIEQKHHIINYHERSLDSNKR